MSERKLSEEQEAEIVRRYQAGELQKVLTTEFRISFERLWNVLKMHGVEKRARGDAQRKLSQCQEAEVIARYQDGDSCEVIARHFSVTNGVIRGVLCRNNEPRRDLSTARLVACGMHIGDAAAISGVSSAMLIELYWGEERLPVRTIANQLGVSNRVVIRLLNKHGITIRTPSEQACADFQCGRRVSCWRGRAKTDNQLEVSRKAIRLAHVAITGRKKSVAHVSIMRAAMLRSVVVHCAWCGSPKTLKASTANRHPWKACNRSCSNRYRGHLRKHGPDAPRPVIVEKLVALVSSRLHMLRPLNPRTGLRSPNTFEQIERLGAELGAREPEIEAVHFAQMEAREGGAA